MKRTISVYFKFIFFIFNLIILNAQDGKMAITSSSKEALDFYIEGVAFQNTFQPLKAQPLFKKALELDPKFAMAQLGLAGTFGQPKFRREAFNKLFEIIKVANLSEGEKIFFDGMVAGFNGDQETRTKKVFELVEKFPKDERALSSVAGYYNGQGETEKALKTYESILDINPRYLPVYNTLGYMYRGLGRMEDAERIFKKAISLNPNNPNGYDSYAELLLKLGRYDESIENYEQSLKIEKIFPSAVMGIASNLLHKGEYNEAVTRLELIHQIAPNDNIKGGVCWAISAVYIDKGDYDNAIIEMNKNLAYSKKHEDYSSMGNDYFNISKIYTLKSDYDLAVKYQKLSLESNLKVIPENQKEQAINNTNYNFINIDILRGNITKAKKDLIKYEAFVNSVNNNRFLIQRVHELKSMIAFEEKRYEDVIKELDLSFQWTYQNMYRKALTYEALGDEKNAKEMYNHIATSRGALNYDYSVLRHIAIKKVASL